MKLLKPFNLIMLVLIPIIMFFGFSLRSYAVVGKGEDYVEFNSSFYRSSPSTYYTYENPVTKTNTTGGVSCSLTSYDWDYFNLEYHIVTSKGDFVVATSSGTSSANLVSVLYLSGSPVGYYGVFRGQVKSGVNTTSVTLSCSTGVGTCTDQSSISADVTVIKQDVNTIKNNTSTLLTRTANIYSDTQEILDILNSLNGGYWFLYSLTNKEYSGDNYIYELSSHRLQFTVPSIQGDFWSYEYYALLSDGSTALIDAGTFDSSTLSVNKVIPTDSFNSCPLKSFVKINGINSSNVTISPTTLVVYLRDKDALNVAIPFIEENWDTIASSEELAQLDIRSEAIDDIILGNNDFENGAFEDLTDGLNDFGFSNWSLVPIATELNTTKNIITMFYNVLPFKIQWLFTSVMALGLIMMLLTVGTRVVQRTGDFTRAKPVKMSYKHKGK